MFVITPARVPRAATIDVQVLQYIIEQLGFGSVRVQRVSNGTSRDILQDQASLFLICLLLNVNLGFPMKQIKFLKFLKAFNKIISNGRLSLLPILPILSTVMPTLQQG